MALDRPLAPLLEGAPGVGRVLPVDRGRTREAIRGIRAEKPALCLNLHGGASSAWMTLFSGARFRAGYAHYSKSLIYNVKIPRAQQTLGRAADAAVHTAEHHASAIFHLGVSRVQIPPARLQAPPAGLDSPRRDKPYAVLHVAAAYETKRWPAERFLALAQFLAERHSLHPVIVAGPGSDHLLNHFPGCERVPAAPIAQLKTLIAGAKLFIGGDSGPAHIAAAFGVPSVVLFGSSDSAVWGPWKTHGEIVETPWDCKPCPGDRCYAFDQPRCILSIDLDPVRQAVDRVLANS